MIIGVSGYGATGASAITALVMECSNIQSYEYGTEFQLLQEPDGILDLYHYIVVDQRRLSSHFAIRRFKNNIRDFGGKDFRKETQSFIQNTSDEYVNSLISAEWYGKSGFDTPDVSNFLYKKGFKSINRIVSGIGRKINPRFIWPPCYKRYYSCLDASQFCDRTKKYLETIFIRSGFNLNCNILLEQLFPPNNPTYGMDFFDECKSIIVERDPRDLYVLTNYLMRHKALFMPNNGDVDSFIKYYRGLHQKKVKDSRVKYVQYEDFIFDYDESSRELLGWLGLKKERERTLFKPEDSINNTYLFAHYPQLKTDIKKIETALNEFLYPFHEKEKQINLDRDIRKAFILKPGDTKTNARN